MEATRPFRVVHANSAFFRSTVETHKIMGETLDSIVKVPSATHTDWLQHAAQTDPLEAELLLEGPSAGCQLRLCPVLSRQQVGSMSHIIVRFDRMMPRATGYADQTDNKPTSAMNQLVGTIG